MSEESKKISPITLEHWKFKFNKSIRILLKNGICTEELIKEIMTINECKDDKKN